MQKKEERMDIAEVLARRRPQLIAKRAMDIVLSAAALAVPVTEPLAAVLTAAGKWQISDIHITDLLDIRTESHYNAT